MQQERPTELSVTVCYKQIRGAPRQQQDALLVGDKVHQADSVSGRIVCAEPILVGVADGVASTPHAARMSRRLLECCSTAYWQDRMVFNARLIRRAQTTLSSPSAGERLKPESASTVALAEIKNGVVTVLNTGDSRAYVIDKTTGEYHRLSKDHTTFELLKESGELPSDAQDCDYGSVATGLLEAVTATPMGDQDFAVHMGYVRLQQDEVVVLCSDGVTTHLSDARIGDSVAYAYAFELDPSQCIVDLVERAGAQDNTTVIIIDSVGSPLFRRLDEPV